MPEPLGVDAVDLLYVHWPVNVYDPEIVLNAYNDLYDQGKIHGVGVSNLLPEHLDEVRDAPEVEKVAERHGVSAVQVSLAWLLSKENAGAVLKASTVTRIRDNFAARPLELDDEDIVRIDGIDRRERLLDPEWGPWNQ